MRPHLFSYATEVNSTNVVYSYSNEQVSTISGDLTYLERVQAGIQGLCHVRQLRQRGILPR